MKMRETQPTECEYEAQRAEARGSGPRLGKGGVLGRGQRRQHRRKCHIGKTKTNKMVFSTEDLILIKVLRQKRLRQLTNDHTASLEITVNVHESVLSRKLAFRMSN